MTNCAEGSGNSEALAEESFLKGTKILGHYGTVETWDWGNAGGQASINVFRENIKPYLRIEKDCGTGTGCWYNGITKNLNGSNYYSFDKAGHLAKVLLADGVSLSLYSWGNAGCHN